MKSKEQLINEIEEKMRMLYEMSSIRDLEKAIDEIDKTIERIEHIKKLFSKLGDEEEI